MKEMETHTEDATQEPQINRNRLIRKLSWLIPASLGILSAACETVVAQHGTCSIDLSFCARCAISAAAFVATFWIIAFMLKRFKGLFAPSIEGGGCSETHLTTNGPQRVLACALIIIISWLPYLIASFPGVYWHDTTSQLLQVLDPAVGLNDHHPIFDTIMIGGAAGIGHLLFKNVFVGTFLLIVFQVILCAFSYSLLLSELEKCGVSARAKKAALLFYALFPFFPMMMSTLCKDTLNLPFFLLFLTFYIRLIRTQGDAPASTWIMLVAFAVLSALTKKTSLIVCALSLVLLIIWIGPLKRRLALAGAVISIMVISGAVAPSIIRALVEYEPGGGQEVLSVPLQQVAAVVKDDPKSLGKHEWRVISNNYLMPVEDIPDSYRWWLADGVKSYWQPANANYKEFLLLWAKLLPSHSEAYFASWAGLSAAWFTPIDPYINSSYEPLATVPLSGGILPKMTQSKLEPTSGIELVNGWPQDSSAGSYLDQLSTALLRIPLVGLAFQRAFWASWVPGFALFYIAHEKAHDKGRLFACLIPTLATLLSLTVGPTSLHQEAIRYLLPMVATAPCLLALTLSISSFNNKAAVCA